MYPNMMTRQPEYGQLDPSAAGIYQSMAPQAYQPNYMTREEAIANAVPKNGFLQPAICTFYLQGSCNKSKDECYFVHPCKEDVEYYDLYSKIYQKQAPNSKITYPKDARITDVRFGELFQGKNDKIYSKLEGSAPSAFQSRPMVPRPQPFGAGHQAPMVGQMNQMNQMGQINQMGQMGQMGQINQMNQMGQMGQMGQINQLGQMPQQMGQMVSTQMGQIPGVQMPPQMPPNVAVSQSRDQQLPGAVIPGGVKTMPLITGQQQQQQQQQCTMTIQHPASVLSTRYAQLRKMSAAELKKMDRVVYLVMGLPSSVLSFNKFANRRDLEHAYELALGATIPTIVVEEIFASRNDRAFFVKLAEKLGYKVRCINICTSPFMAYLMHSPRIFSMLDEIRMENMKMIKADCEKTLLDLQSIADSSIMFDKYLAVRTCSEGTGELAQRILSADSSEVKEAESAKTDMITQEQALYLLKAMYTKAMLTYCKFLVASSEKWELPDATEEGFDTIQSIAVVSSLDQRGEEALSGKEKWRDMWNAFLIRMAAISVSKESTDDVQVDTMDALFDKIFSPEAVFKNMQISQKDRGNISPYRRVAKSPPPEKKDMLDTDDDDASSDAATLIYINPFDGEKEPGQGEKDPIYSKVNRVEYFYKNIYGLASCISAMTPYYHQNSAIQGKMDHAIDMMGLGMQQDAAESQMVMQPQPMGMQYPQQVQVPFTHGQPVPYQPDQFQYAQQQMYGMQQPMGVGMQMQGPMGIPQGMSQREDVHPQDNDIIINYSEPQRSISEDVTVQISRRPPILEQNAADDEDESSDEEEEIM